MNRAEALAMANEIRIARSARRRAAALEMRAEGHTAKRVAKTLGITESMVRRYIRDARRDGTLARPGVSS